MFYHIIVETKPQGNEKSETYAVFDIEDKKTIIEKFVKPYINGEDFGIDGYNVNRTRMKRFFISETETPVKNIVQQLRMQFRANGKMIPINREMIASDDSYAKNITNEIIESVGNNGIHKVTNNESNNHDVFIVHGRNNDLKNEVALFLNRIELIPIILHEQISSSMTIIEKLEKYTNVCFAIILYTGCDVGSLREPQELKPRARQNVIFEHGYLTGKLGRSRVCALVENNVELPSDINGIVFITYDAAGSWKYTIAKEMQAVGIDIDMNKIV